MSCLGKLEWKPLLSFSALSLQSVLQHLMAGASARSLPPVALPLERTLEPLCTVCIAIATELNVVGSVWQEPWQVPQINKKERCARLYFVSYKPRRGQESENPAAIMKQKVAVFCCPFPLFQMSMLPPGGKSLNRHQQFQK